MAKQKEIAAHSSELLGTLSFKDTGLQIPEKIASNKSFSEWVRALMQNWRQGTVGCKDRSEVAFSNKKPWKQKGTGRARAGSARSPLWRKGGVVFGPQPRVKIHKVSKNLKKHVLGSLAYQQLESGRVLTLDWNFEGDKPKTSVAYTLLRNAKLTDYKTTLFLPIDDMLTYASFVNIPNVRILFYDQANAFDLTQGDYWVVFNRDLDLFKEMVGKWI